MNDPLNRVLLTDLYQLTMLQGYFDQGMEEEASFEFFVRDLPENRGFLLAAGLEQALQYLEKLHFTPEELTWLRNDERFTNEFVDYLEGLRFAGEVHAMAEGTAFFPDEPILRVVAPLPQAQLVESRIINLLQFQTLIASKAARCVLAAPDKQLVDFGLRRSHGAEAGLLAARATYIAGFAGSSTVLAALLFNIPIFGTMAHSFIQAHDDEMTAFENFARSQKDNVVLLIDTYDTEAGARKVVELAAKLAKDDIRIRAVRLDSGDLNAHARKVRQILDEGGLEKVKIFSSGGIDEEVLKKLLSGGTKLDGFGIGTRLDTSADAPYLDCAYKLTEYAGISRRKKSEGKATWPGRKQVYRRYDNEGRMEEDLLSLESDVQEGEALLQPVMEKGRRLQRPEALAVIRDRTEDSLACLPEHLRRLEQGPAYPVKVAEMLQQLADEVDARLE